MNTVSERAIPKFNEVLKDKDAFKKVKLTKTCAGRCSEAFGLSRILIGLRSRVKTDSGDWYIFWFL